MLNESIFIYRSHDNHHALKAFSSVVPTRNAVNFQYHLSLKLFVMTSSSISKKETCVYPGEFIPHCYEKTDRIFGKETASFTSRPLVNILESAEMMRIEILIPGVRKEEFTLEIENNKLSVHVHHHVDETFKNHDIKLHEFDCERFECEFKLPKNADVLFIQARYVNGILCLHVPKAQHPIKQDKVNIAVY